MSNFTITFTGPVEELIDTLKNRFQGCTVKEVMIRLSDDGVPPEPPDPETVLKSQVLEIVQKTGTISAIKHLRAVQGLMLGEAKVLVERWIAESGVQPAAGP
jgi:ribosomal protein L7/L12